MAFTVALIGPDGSGKTTVCRNVQQAGTLPVRYLYMGVSRDSSNRMLPTTRLLRSIRRLCGARPDNRGPRDKSEADEKPGGIVRRGLKGLKSFASLGNRLCEEWYRQGIAWYYQSRGYLVLFDRHFFIDYYHYDIVEGGQRRPLSRRMHGFLLQHCYPRPHLVLFLDAPAEVLFARKGEGTVELLEERRRDYLRMREAFEHFEVIDADRSAEAVTDDVVRRIVAFQQQSRSALRRPLHEVRT